MCHNLNKFLTDTHLYEIRVQCVETKRETTRQVHMSPGAFLTVPDLTPNGTYLVTTRRHYGGRVHEALSAPWGGWSVCVWGVCAALPTSATGQGGPLRTRQSSAVTRGRRP